MKTIALIAISGAVLIQHAVGLPQSLSQGPYSINIILERRQNGRWNAVESRLVLDQDEMVRFRIRTNFNGYLYVTNLSTSGRYDLLFPSRDAGADNKVQAGKDYVIPATERGSFRVTGPPGQEIVYWLVSPGVIDNRGEPPSQPQRKLPTLVPRCDETILRARGDCLDTTAGPKVIQDPAGLPADIAGIKTQSRDLIFIQHEKSSVVSSISPLQAPAIYEFRISHR